MQLVENPDRLNRLLKLSYKKYAELCSLVDKAADINNLGWYQKVKEYQNTTAAHNPKTSLESKHDFAY